MTAYLGELVGTMLLIILGGGVNAGVVLNKSKAQNSGWIVITIGWGLAVSMSIYAIGKVSGAHINPAVTLGLASIGEFPMKDVLPYVGAQFLGALLGAVVVYFHYLPHWGPTEDQDLKLAVFSTSPAVPRPAANLLSEIIGTFVLLAGIMGIGANEFTQGLNPLVVGLLIVIIGMGLGGTTGYAINPARDLGPRLAHFLLPIIGKGSSHWSYAWIPLLGPLIGGVYGCVFYRALFNGEFTTTFWVTTGIILVVATLAIIEEFKRKSKTEA